jgi:hypothetical protein
MNSVIGILIGLLILIGFVWLGLRIKPRAIAAYPEPAPEPQAVRVPDDLPPPVARHYRLLYGDEVPVITSAVVSGRATIRPFGFSLPARFRFTHQAGQGYRHYIEATFYGIPVFRVNEHYLDGHGHLELPIVGLAEGPHTDQAANLGLWAETSYLPAILVTDPRVHWEAIDDETALLFVPFGQGEQHFVVRFDLESGRQTMMEAMRYRDEAGDKILWLAAAVPGATIEAGGATLDATGSATWLDQGSPWAFFTAEEIVYNVDVEEYIRAQGP